MIATPRLTYIFSLLFLLTTVLTSCLAVYAQFSNLWTSSSGAMSATSFRQYFPIANQYQLIRHRRDVKQDVKSINESLSKITQNDSLENDDFTDWCWVRVAQARALAIVGANDWMPKLDEDAELIKPSHCYRYSLNPFSSCLNFTEKCADEAATLLEYHLAKKRQKSIQEQMAIYMRYMIDMILEKCKMSHILKYINQNKIDLKHESPPKNAPNPTPVFHCNQYTDEGDVATHFRMEYQPFKLNPSFAKLNLSSDLIPRYFVVELNVDGKWLLHPYLVVPNWLMRTWTLPGHRYQIRVTAVSQKYVYPPVTSALLTIYDFEKLTLRKPTSLYIDKIHLDETLEKPRVSALMRWKSGSGENASCDADVHSTFDIQSYLVEKEIEMKAFWVKLDNLDFGQNYSVRVVEKSLGGKKANASGHMHIPSCLEMRRHSLDLCPPPPPSNFRLENVKDDSFWVAWDAPMYTKATNRILYYYLSIERGYNINRKYSQIPGCSSVREQAIPSIQHNEFAKVHELFSGEMDGNKTSLLVRNLRKPFFGDIKIVIKAIGSKGSSVKRSIVCVTGSRPSDSILRTFVGLAFVFDYIFKTVFWVIGLIVVLCLIRRFRSKRN